MKQLIPLKSNNNRTINAIQFNDVQSSLVITLAADTEYTITVPDGAKFVRFVFPVGNIVWVSDTQTITIPAADDEAIENAEINPGIREISGISNLYALSSVELSFGVYFYNG
ncbi:MAG: hypothetical protein R3321_09740 [Nitrososphaeraceae archaeon]|nr:hypothetical protein [Nitrososphaeraceae archaeon]